MTLVTLTVLKVLLDDPVKPAYGLEISRLAGLKSGTIYPALARLERAGWIESSWEEVDPRKAGRPRRRLYRLSAEGAGLARGAVAEHTARLAPGAHATSGAPVRPEPKVA